MRCEHGSSFEPAADLGSDSRTKSAVNDGLVSQRQHSHELHLLTPVTPAEMCDADLTSCQQLQDWYYDRYLVYDDNIILVVLPAITSMSVCPAHNSTAGYWNVFIQEVLNL